MQDPYRSELKQRIDEVLLHIWDPIGVGASPETHDEYETYANQILELVFEGSRKEQISAHLSKVMLEQLELEPVQEHNDTIATFICDLMDAFQEAKQLDISASEITYISADKDGASDYHATDMSDRLADFLKFEYVDTLNKEWQIWLYPSGIIYDVRPDQSFSPTDRQYYSHPGDGGWNVELIKNSINKSLVNKAYNRLLAATS
jgi:hypothetical protein